MNPEIIILIIQLFSMFFSSFTSVSLLAFFNRFKESKRNLVWRLVVLVSVFLFLHSALLVLSTVVTINKFHVSRPTLFYFFRDSSIFIAAFLFMWFTVFSFFERLGEIKESRKYSVVR